MNNIISIEELKELSGKEEIIASYCNKDSLDIDNRQLNDSINSFLVSLCAIIKSKKNNIVYYVANAIDIKDKKYIRVKYKIGKVEQKMNLNISRVGYDKFINNLMEFINISILGSEAIEYVNSRIADIQSNGNSSISIEYKISITEGNCDIYDWDYDSVTVRLNKKSSIRLIEAYNNNEIDKFIENSNWSHKICDYINEFNSIKFNEYIGANLEYSNISDELMKNMIKSDDMGVIADKMKIQGISNIKTVSIIRELGVFIVICNWKIRDNKITMDIMYNKVLDIENNRFISNEDIVGRLKEKIYKQCNLK